MRLAASAVTGTLLPLVGAGHQYRENLLLVLGPERTWVQGQQPTVASLKACGVTHVSSPPAGFKRDNATTALACNQAASAVNSSAPSGVSR
jgi:hypothetical protein